MIVNRKHLQTDILIVLTWIAYCETQNHILLNNKAVLVKLDIFGI